KASVPAAVEARKLAEDGWLVTFGIAPTRPETGFGYIEADQAIDGLSANVNRFVEKPDARAAEEMIQSGRYSWNSGMFCFAASAVIAAFKQHAPEVLRAVEKTIAATDYAKAPPVLAEAEFAKAPDVSFDYAVMEKAER